MEIKGKVHCFFEQSGTFKNEFKKYEHFLDSKEVVRIKEEILSQIIKIKGWGK